MVECGARAGTLANLLTEEVSQAEEVTLESGETRFVVSISSHKTTMSGVSYISMRPEIFKALQNVANTAKTLESKYVFCTSQGKQFKTSRVSASFRVVWKNTGFLEQYGEFNATLNQKRIATLALKQYGKFNATLNQKRIATLAHEYAGM